MNLADQIAALSKRITDVRGMVPSYEWATVASVSPPTVILDSDVTNTPRPVADVLVANLAVADRVEVRAIGSRRDVIARAGGPLVAASSIVGELDVSNIPGLPASKITSGTLSPERLPMVQGRVQVPAGGTQIGILYYSATITITLPVGVFTSPPRVRISSSGPGVHFACVQGTPTASDFRAVLTRLDAYPDGTQYFEWEAWQA